MAIRGDPHAAAGKAQNAFSLDGPPTPGGHWGQAMWQIVTIPSQARKPV